MHNHSNDQKRIAKNTIMLYIRMIVIMIVTLYTTRVVLEALGETDFGIYNIVGSVVVSMAFIQNSLMSATQRFLSYEMGLRDQGNIADVFSASMVLHMRFLLLIVLILETVGLWFLNEVLDIPTDRITAANIVYQFSLLTFCLNLLRIPYNAIIISYESMNIYAILSIAEALLKLSVVIALKYLSFDKLVLYGILIFFLTFIINALYIAYCHRNYEPDIHLKFKVEKKRVKEMQGFLGWNLLGGITGIATGEGPNYFMNYYLGVSVNAAMGIAKQVSGAVYQFASNFQFAFNPQIVKAYAAREKEYLLNLINKTSLLSFYLLFIIAFPIIICSNYIFNLWLVDVPQYAIEFCLLMMVGQMVSALGSPLWMVAHATGDIKMYQIIISCINLTIIPASFIILSLGLKPYYILVFHVVQNLVILIYRLLFAKYRIGLSLRNYIKAVILRTFFLVLCIIPIPIYLAYYADGLWQNLGIIILAVFISIFVFYYGGLDNETKLAVRKYVNRKMNWNPFQKNQR